MKTPFFLFFTHLFNDRAKPVRQQAASGLERRVIRRPDIARDGNKKCSNCFVLKAWEDHIENTLKIFGYKYTGDFDCRKKWQRRFYDDNIFAICLGVFAVLFFCFLIFGSRYFPEYFN